MALNSGLTEGFEISIEDPFDELDDVDWDDIPILENNVNKTEQQTINMLRDLEAYNEISKYVEGQTLVDYGYVAPKKLYGRSPEGTKAKLVQLSLDMYPVVEDRILMQKCDMESGSEEAFLVNPVLMAVILEEYEIAEKLIEKGYSVDDRFLEKQIYMKKSPETFDDYNWHDISITQLLFARPQMPEKLRYEICDVLSLIRPVFDYNYDCRNNPFLETETVINNNSIYNVKRNLMEGFEAIYQTDSELLEGIFEGENTQSVFLNEMCGYNREQQEKIFDRLLTYMAGTEDVRFLIEKLAKLSMGPFVNEEDSEIGSVWWKLFPKIKQICEYDEGCTDECIQVLMDNYNLYTPENGRLSKHLQKRIELHTKRQLQRLERAIRDLCTVDYTQEKLMDYLCKCISSDRLGTQWMRIERVIWYLNFWKSVLKRGWRPVRFDKSFVEILDAALHYTVCVSATATEEGKEQCIQQSIDLIELLDGVSYEECPIKEFGYEQADFMNKIMQLESEELFMLCVEKNLIPKELLPIAADAALELGYTKLMPSIIYLQSQKGVC